MTVMNEEARLSSQVEEKLESYTKNPLYKQCFEKLADTTLGKMRGVNEGHIYGLGSQLESWDNYYKGLTRQGLVPAQFSGKTKNEAGSLNDLPVLPRLAYDLLITNMGNNPISVFAGIQPISSSNGDVYVKQLIAANTRGNTTSGQIISSPLQQPEVFTDYFIGSNNPETTIATTAGSSPSAGPYTTTLTRAPLRKNSARVTVSATIYGQDDGNGFIIGRGLEGTIDYTTGAISVTFTTASIPVSTAIKVTYTSNLEESGAYAKLNLAITKVPVQAEPFVIGQEFGVFQTWEIEQMFGRLAQEDSMNDLSQAMMAEISNKLINKFYNQVLADSTPNLTTWDATPPANTSDYLHRMTLPFAFAKAGQKLYSRTGRATIDFYLGDPIFCSYIETLEGFEMINVVSQGAHIFGKYKGAVVVRCPQLPAGEAVLGFNGTGMFDRPGVWATYMPILFLHPNIPVPNNVLKVQGAAVSYGAAELVIKRFLTRFQILNYT